MDKLQLEDFLRKNGWVENMIHTALSTLTVRTVYAISERSSHYYLYDNSVAAGPHSGVPGWILGTNSLHKITDKLHELKEQLERHLCSVIDNLFSIDNKLMLFDLTDFYFKGSKRNNDKAKFGRLKEKHSDYKLLVLVLCINKEGSIHYSSVSKGNTTGPKSLPNMIDTLAKRNPPRTKDVLIVMDVGVATKENLELVKRKGYNYLCVSRMKMKDYTLSDNNRSVTVMGARRQKITLKEIETEDDRDYYLEITSPSKVMTKSSINGAWRECFGMELQRINEEIPEEGGTKTYEKVIECVGRVIQEYPSIMKFYQISYIKNEKESKQVLRVDWEVKDLSAMESGCGAYFLRNNVRTLSERVTWECYNLTREIKCTNRQLKNDPDLRPIYHQKDERSDAHLFFGLLAYWVIDTIRY